MQSAEILWGTDHLSEFRINHQKNLKKTYIEIGKG